MSERDPGTPVLSGLKVVEFAQLIAGPMAGSFLADLGADVVHVEDPIKGDPQRVTGIAKDGVYLWWKVSARNKRCVTLDLRTPAGRAVALQLVEWADVVITNFKPSTLTSWQLDWPALREHNPTLIMLQVSGFGVGNSRSAEPGFGKLGEAMSGIVHLTGFPDGPPVHTGFSHADSVTGLMGAFAITAALHRRANDPDFAGEWIDLALFEPLYRLVEWQAIVHDQTGQVPMRAGNSLAVSPAAVINTFLTADQQWVTVTSGTARSVRNVAALLGEPAADYATPELQHQHRDHLNQVLAEWIAARDLDRALREMQAAEIVASSILSIADIFADETYREREDIVSLEDPELGPVRMQSVLPKFANHPGVLWRTGPELGADNDLVYTDILKMPADELRRLRAEGTV